MSILNPPKSYVDYRCYIHGLSGNELISAQDKFYKKNYEYRGEISRFLNYIDESRQFGNLPFEKVEIKDLDGKKRGNIQNIMIYDIEYWIEGGRIKQRKIYMGEQGQFTEEREQLIRDPGEEG